MATSGDITVAQDGGQSNVKLHPYLVTLVRWCVSCLWSSATVLLHRIMTTPLQPITGPKPHLAPKPRVPKRVAGTEHLHPEPRVECQLLHQPATHTMDVIFVHGLYGSLGNTWRQGDWHQKYKKYPPKVPLRNHSTPNACSCHVTQNNDHIYNENKCDDNITDLNDPEMSFKKINEKLSKKVIPKENDLITEQFYNNTLVDQVQIVDNYDTQAKFVQDLFKKENNCDNNCDGVEQNCYSDQEYNDTNTRFKCDNNETDNDFKCNFSQVNEFDECKCDYNETDNDFKCKFSQVNEFDECKCIFNEKKCEIGCGCVCNDCYSSCWPKDWIKVDFPGARVISINYTSDPYLWRPLWIKENKRLNLYQRAEQMIEQLLELGVGEKPIIWVGHSKGGLFIKQIYCEAYDAYMKVNESSRTSNEKTEISDKRTEETPNDIHNGITAANIDTIIGHFSHDKEETRNSLTNDNCTGNIDNCTGYIDDCTGNNENYTETNDNSTGTNDNNRSDDYTRNNYNWTRKNDNYRITNNNYMQNNNSCVMHETVQYKNVFEQTNIAKNENANNNNLEYVNVINDNVCDIINKDGSKENAKEMLLKNGNEDLNSSIEVEASRVSRRASLWASSRGFMFYSVPHRGSPLADIKTPVTARSVDLLEIAKDCPLVLRLQARWLAAAGGGGASVRSVVETCRTLMSVLWLRIVSTDSADAGLGVLSGMSVDHREICKPTSRSCVLYTELIDLINDALKCRCQ